MFRSVISQNLYLSKKLSSLFFSAQSSTFIKRAKTLEGWKNSSTVPDIAFHQGKYMILLKCESVFVDENSKLLWKNFQDIESIMQNHSSNQKILLHISPDCDTDDICLFAIDLSISCDQDVKELERNLGGRFIDARESLLKLNNRECKYVAQAKGLSHFMKTFNFCPKCGNELVVNVIGTQKQCQKCQRFHYPTVSPVGIVLLDDVRHEKVLLVHQKRHPPGMYSCVAGFIEPGETLYESIKREVAEEVGLEIVNVEFCTSQPWAMPSAQLMLACIASVDKTEFSLDENEILSAKWVEANILRDALTQILPYKTEASPSAAKELLVPPAFTVSYQIMAEWLKKYHPL